MSATGGLSNIPSDFLLSAAPGVPGQTAQVGFVVLSEGRADGGPPASVEARTAPITATLPTSTPNSTQPQYRTFISQPPRPAQASVSLKMDVNPRDPYDERYRAVSRARAQRSSIHTREMKAMDVREAPRAVPLPARVNVTRAAADAAKAAKGIKVGEKCAAALALFSWGSRFPALGAPLLATLPVLCCLLRNALRGRDPSSTASVPWTQISVVLRATGASGRRRTVPTASKRACSACSRSGFTGASSSSRCGRMSLASAARFATQGCTPGVTRPAAVGPPLHALPPGLLRPAVSHWRAARVAQGGGGRHRRAVHQGADEGVLQPEARFPAKGAGAQGGGRGRRGGAGGDGHELMMDWAP